ncbi:MAG: FG-GAP repeat protein [Woeseiaceae bacterium]|nr:FG-GAP repeat protein [Woeseiaceae bacterium]
MPTIESASIRILGTAVAVILAGLSSASDASVEVTTLAAEDPGPDQYFGFSVAISGSTVAVGAQGDDDNGEESGAAYVFVSSERCWSQQAKIAASDAAAGDQFGGSIALDGDTLLAGARRNDDSGNDSGAAYLFERSGSEWIQTAKLEAWDGDEGDEFGRSVALSGDTAILAAPMDDDNGEDSGSVYVFTRSGHVWTQQAKLTAPDGAKGDLFGISVAFDGDTLLIGADLDDDNGENTGSVYVFVRSNDSWSHEAKLTAADAGDVDIFGVRVALYGDTALIAARRDDDETSGADSGSAYVFVRSGSSWTQQAKLTAGDAETGDLFGYNVGLYADTAIVTAAMDDDKAENSGAAYLFFRSGSKWTQQAKFTAPNGAKNDVLGWSVALSADTAVVGAPTSIHDPSGRSGLVHLLRRSGESWSQITDKPADCKP